MAPGEVMQQGRVGSVLLLLLLLTTFLGAAHATEWTVGDNAAKWSYLHPNATPDFYTVWASNRTLTTGDTLLFKYDNTTHTVLELRTEADLQSCILNASVAKWTSGSDAVFISKAGTYYFVCGAPSHCDQGMKFAITATGSPVAAPPVAPNGTTAGVTSHAPPSPALQSRGVLVASAILALAAAFCVTLV